MAPGEVKAQGRGQASAAAAAGPPQRGDRSPSVQRLRSPEGIELALSTAGISDRAVALMIDLLWMGALLLVAALTAGYLLGLGGFLLVFFLIRHGYFLWFEARGNGATPGKRRLALRVVRADGGPLTTEILLARNLTREVELFLPVILVLNPDLMFAEHQGVVRLIASSWVLLLLLFPLTNPARLRIGDLLAGTRVVFVPDVALARDLADSHVGKRAPKEASVVEFAFRPDQLAVYGERELAVLEDVLRKARREGGEPAIAAVAASIAKKIGYEKAAIGERSERFLRAFYTAQREHLEQRLVLGRRRQHKVGRGEA